MATLEQGLRKLKVLSKFRRAHLQDSNRLRTEQIAELLLSNNPYKLRGCFVWSTTKEGHDFWEDILNKLEK